jgi:hypothetical protein
MTTVEAHGISEGGQAERHLAEVLAGGSVGEALGGAGAVVLAILGLAGVLPAITAPVASLAVGGGLMFVGGAVAARLSRLLKSTGGALAQCELGSGMSAEFLGGGAGVVLSILALLRVAPTELLSVAALVYGGAILLGSGVTARLNHLQILGSQGHPLAQEVAREATRAAAGTQVLVGLGAIVLGILSLVGVAHETTLVLVAMLGLGGSILLSGSAVTGRIVGVFHH